MKTRGGKTIASLLRTLKRRHETGTLKASRLHSGIRPKGSRGSGFPWGCVVTWEPQPTTAGADK